MENKKIIKMIQEEADKMYKKIDGITAFEIGVFAQEIIKKIKNYDSKS